MRQGKWIKGRNLDRYERETAKILNGSIRDGLKYCSSCGTVAPLAGGIRTETEYCPNCHTYMREKKGEKR